MKLKITYKMVRRLEPCSAALRLLKPLLPVTLSSYPEDNLNLAIRLLDIYANTVSCLVEGCPNCRRHLSSDLDWFFAYYIQPSKYRDSKTVAGTTSDFRYLYDLPRTSLLEVTQMMAMIVDAHKHVNKLKKSKSK